MSTGPIPAARSPPTPTSSWKPRPGRPFRNGTSSASPLPDSSVRRTGCIIATARKPGSVRRPPAKKRTRRISPGNMPLTPRASTSSMRQRGAGQDFRGGRGRPLRRASVYLLVWQPDPDTPVRFVGTDQDITEQVKATELLRESEARLKSAERMTHVGNWIWDIKANRVSLSEEMFRILGQPRNYEPSYEASLQMIVPEDRDRTEQWAHDMEVKVKRPGGTPSSPRSGR